MPESLKTVPIQVSASPQFAEVLQALGISLLVTTYQAGKLMVVRSQADSLNIHCRDFKKIMGLAANQRRIALGTASQVREFYNMPELATKLEPIGQHDACYLPRNTHVTGNIDIHEMAWAGNELWMVNTRFSCLCTLDLSHSFVPRWRPPFVTALAADDRCHLNGLAVIGEQPRLVTALGATDTTQGWRANKAKGGLLMEIDSNTILRTGLSMPHSPRWHRDSLWLAESGQGSLVNIDINTYQLETVASFPGFTRGLDFYGNFAFVGLSQIRETAVFSGLPLTERLQDRICGVWIIDLNTGKTVAKITFDAGVQEIFAVTVLPGIRFPEILPEGEKLVSTSYVLPDKALADVPVDIRDQSVC